MSGRRYPLDELERLACLRSDYELGRRLHVSHRTLVQLRTAGLDEFQADRYACRVGRHPLEVWPDW